tara:strand:- start:101 stop:373 length:273 start_codon:yes stop_codon:yes gene_type:complete
VQEAEENKNMNVNNNYLIGAAITLAVALVGYISFSTGDTTEEVAVIQGETLEIVVVEGTADENQAEESSDDKHETVPAVEVSEANNDASE